MSTINDLIAITLTRAEWTALVIAGSLAETVSRHHDVLINDVEPGYTFGATVDRARSFIAFMLHNPKHVQALRQNIKIALDTSVLKNVRVTPSGLVKRRPMSKKNRQAVSARMRKYWAAKRKGGAK